MPAPLKPVFQWQSGVNLAPVPIRSPETIERERKEKAERETQALAEMAARERWRWRGPKETKWGRLPSRRRRKEIERTSRETAFEVKAAEFARELKEALGDQEQAASEASINAALARLADEHEAERRVGERVPVPAVYWILRRVITDHDYIVAMFASYSRCHYRLL